MKGKSQKRRTTANQDESQRTLKRNRFGELRAYSKVTEREIGREVLRGPDDSKPALERLLARDPSFTDFVIHFVPGARTVNRILTTSSGRALVVSEVEKYVTAELSHRLSQTDFELFQRHHLEPPGEALPRIYAAMDSAIFQVAVEQGPIILLAPEILQRVTDWTLEGDSGARCWNRLGNYFAQFTLVTLGLKTSSLEGWWAWSRTDLIQEVRELQKSLQARFQARNNIPADWVLLDAAVDTVEGEPGTFSKLGQINVPLQLFLSAQPQPLRNLLAGSLTPALFVDQLIGWITNYAPGSVRQVIYRLP